MNKNILIILIFIISFSACKYDTNASRVDYLPYYNEATFTPRWHSPEDSVLDTFHQVSSFELINQEGELLTNENFKNKIYVVDFFFTVCPGLCPKMTANMTTVQDEFINDDEILLLSHSVTPARDSVSVLKQYALDKGIITDKWHLVTGERDEIYRLGRQEYFIEEDLGLTMEEDDFLHTENFVLVDKKGHLRGIYNGLNKTSVKQLITDIKSLKQE